MERTDYLTYKFKSFQSALQKTFATTAVIDCDERSTIYFNKNLLTPAEFLNALDLTVKYNKVSFEYNESIVEFNILPCGLQFVDLDEFDRFNARSFKLNLLKTILEACPSEAILDKLEGVEIRELSDFIKFILENTKELDWYNKCQDILLSYFYKNLKDLSFSIAYKPVVLFCFFMYEEETIEENVQKKANSLIKKHKDLFDQELWANTHLSAVIMVMFDIEKFDSEIKDSELNKQLHNLTSLLKSYQIFKIPINNPQKSDDKEIFDSSFDFNKHVYFKNKIQSYHISEFEKLNANTVSEDERAKCVNKYDTIILRDNVEKALNDSVVNVYKRTLQYFYTNILTLKKNKKKSFWSFFGGNKNEKNSKDEEIDHKLMIYQFNLAETYFLTSNFEQAAVEFKSLVNTYNKMDIAFFTVCLEYYIYSLVFCTKMANLYSKVDGIVQKLMGYFNDPNIYDVLRCNRLSCLANLILKFGKYFEGKRANAFEESYLEYELNFNRMDRNADFEFLKPIFKEEYCYKYLVSQKNEMRNFLFNLIITADYFGMKLKENKHHQYTLYLYMFVFNYYKNSAADWSYLIHFITQTISKNKKQMGRFDYALKMYLKFINTYYQNNVKKESEEHHVKIYLGKLLDNLQKTELTNLNELRVFEFEHRYTLINSDSFYNNKISSEDVNSFDVSEFMDLLDKRLNKEEIHNFEALHEEIELLYVEKDEERNDILRSYIKESYLGEEMLLELNVNNFFNVS